MAPSRDRDPANVELDAVTEASAGYSGAEIEQSIITSMYEAFADDGREVTDEDLTRGIKLTVPLCVTMKEKIDAIREWANTRAVAASINGEGEAKPQEAQEAEPEDGPPPLEMEMPQGGRQIEL